METTLEKLRRSTSFQYCWSSSAWLSSRSSWDQSRVFSALLTTSTIWSSKSLTHWICGSRKSRSRTNHSISNQLFTTISESTLSKLSFMISTWLLKSSSSISRLRQRCRPIWFRTQEYSKNLSAHLITFSKNVREVSRMSSSFRCTAVFQLQASVSSATRAMWRKCTSFAKVL